MATRRFSPYEARQETTMLGDINPQSVRIAQQAVVYPGRNHVNALTIKRYDGRRFAPVDLTDTTRVVLAFPSTDPTVVFDSAVDAVFTWAGNTLTVDLSDYAMPASIQPCYLIVFDAEHPQGQVLVDNIDAVLEFDFRLVPITGTTPPPTADFLIDSPQDGETYGRKDGTWVPMDALLAGVASFNGRGGVVILTSGDVTNALGYTPVDGADLAAVASSGAYADLAGKPSIPSTPGDIGAASAAQGALADTAVQPAALAAGLAGKVDKITGKGLSQEDFTTAEKAKLAGLESSRFKGLFVSLAALETAFPTASAGDYADVDAGVGSDTVRYVWDVSDAEWQQSGSGSPLTAAEIKILYESNPDTNAFTDADESKLDGIAAGATANANTDSLAEGSTNLYFTTLRVLATLMSGFTLVAGGTVLNTDSLLVAVGKLQSQIDGLTAALSGKQDTLVSGTNVKTINGESVLGSGDLTVSGGATLPVVQSLTSSRTLALADANTFNVNSTASAYTATVPAQATVAWAADTEIHFLRAGTGAITITAAAGVALNGVTAGSVTMNAQHGAVTIKRIGLNAWWLGGLVDDAIGDIAATLDAINGQVIV
jgi:hypothetical protein